MKHWSERLRAWMRDEGLKVPDVARLSGISEESLYKYLKGRTDAPRGDVLARIAAAFGKTAVELRYGIEGNRTPPNQNIPLLRMDDLSSLTDLQSVLSNWRGPSVLVPAFEWHETTFAVEIRDNACAPKIEAGDTVIVDTQALCAPSDLVLAYISAMGTAVCRRYRPSHAIKQDTFGLAALNPDFPQIEVGSARDGHLIGRVMKIVKTV